MDQAAVIIGEGVLLALLCLLTARQAREQRRTFESVLAAARQGEYSPEVAYRVYRRASSHWASQAMVWYATMLLFAIFIAILDVLPGFLTTIGVPSPFVPAFFTLMGLIFIAPPLLLSALTANVDAAALVQLNGVRTSARTLLIFRLKRNALLFLPPTLTIVEGVALFLLGTPPFRALVFDVCALLGEYAVIILLYMPISRWLYHTEPIEQTQWADVGARAHEWARLSGVPLRHVFVRRVEQLGLAMNLFGWPFSRSLYLSDTFLSHSEWRQRDALICQLLTFHNPPAQRQPPRQRRFAQVTLALLIVTIIGWGVYLSTLGNITIYDGLTFNGLLQLLTVGWLIGVFITIIIATRQHGRSAETDDIVTPNDRAALALCGDPLALAAMAITTSVLTGSELNSGFLSGRWSLKDHILAVERTLRQPGPFAPWAFQPIPTLEPLPVEPTLEAFTLSVPLAGAATEAHPAPVPTTPHQVIDSPWQETPEPGS